MSRRWSPGLGRAGAAAGRHPPHLEAWTWGTGLQNYPLYPLDSRQPESSLGMETMSDSSLGSCCPGPGLAHREPSNACAHLSAPPPNTAAHHSCRLVLFSGELQGRSRWPPSPAGGRAPPQHRLGTGGLGQRVDGKEGIPIRKDVKLLHCLPLTQPTRVAARTQQCSGQIPRPPHMPQVLWVQQPTGLQKAPSPGETDVPGDPSICP